MMIRMNNLAITSYRKCDVRKFRFAKELKNDRDIRKYLYKNIDESLVLSQDLESLECGESYIIAEKDKLIGYIRLADYDDTNNSLELHYAVHPSFRDKGYGKKILTEVSNYILEKYKNVSSIDLYISEFNIGSIRCAQEAGFKFIEKYESCEKTAFVYRKNR